MEKQYIFRTDDSYEFNTLKEALKHAELHEECNSVTQYNIFSEDDYEEPKQVWVKESRLVEEINLKDIVEKQGYITLRQWAEAPAGTYCNDYNFATLKITDDLYLTSEGWEPLGEVENARDFILSCKENNAEISDKELDAPWLYSEYSIGDGSVTEDEIRDFFYFIEETDDEDFEDEWECDREHYDKLIKEIVEISKNGLKESKQVWVRESENNILAKKLGQKLLPKQEKKKPKYVYEIYWFDTEDCKDDPIFKKFWTKKAQEKWYEEHKNDSDKFNMYAEDGYNVNEAFKVGQTVKLNPENNKRTSKELLDDEFEVIGFWDNQKTIKDDKYANGLNSEFRGVQIKSKKTGIVYDLNAFQLQESKQDNDSNEIKPFTYSQVLQELKLSTNNFTKDFDGVYSFESEAEIAIKILEKKNYNIVDYHTEDSKFGLEYIIKAEKISLTEAKEDHVYYCLSDMKMPKHSILLYGEEGKDKLLEIAPRYLKYYGQAEIFKSVNGNQTVIWRNGEFLEKEPKEEVVEESFWEQSKELEEFQDYLKDKVDYNKWNDLTKEERINLVKEPIKKYVKLNKDNVVWQILLKDLEDNNYHTEYKVLKDILSGLDESKKLAETFGDDFYGYKKGTEKADDVLFALQVQYGHPEYNYDDFKKLNLTKDDVEKAINFVKEKGYNKFTYFDESLKESKQFLKEFYYLFDEEDVDTIEKIDELIKDFKIKSQNTFDSHQKWVYNKNLDKLYKIKNKLQSKKHAEENGDLLTTREVYKDIKDITGLSKIQTVSGRIKGIKRIINGSIEVENNGNYYTVNFYNNEKVINDLIKQLKEKGYIIDNDSITKNSFDIKNYKLKKDESLEENKKELKKHNLSLKHKFKQSWFDYYKEFCNLTDEEVEQEYGTKEELSDTASYLADLYDNNKKIARLMYANFEGMGNWAELGIDVNFNTDELQKALNILGYSSDGIDLNTDYTLYKPEMKAIYNKEVDEVLMPYIKDIEDVMNEKEIKESLKESTNKFNESKELDRQLFVSLVKLGDEPYEGYSILKDGNFVKRIYAESDEEAIKKFRDYINKGSVKEAKKKKEKVRFVGDPQKEMDFFNMTASANSGGVVSESKELIEGLNTKKDFEDLKAELDEKNLYYKSFSNYWSKEGSYIYFECFETDLKQIEDILKEKGIQIIKKEINKYISGLINKNWYQLSLKVGPNFYKEYWGNDDNDEEDEDSEDEEELTYHYAVYRIYQDDDVSEEIASFDTKEEAIEWAKKQPFRTCVSYDPEGDPDDYGYPDTPDGYEAFEVIWDSELNESLKESIEDLYVTIESGGSLGEISRYGNQRIVGKPCSKEEAKEKTKRMSKLYSGGYYGYKYETKPLSWAISRGIYKEEQKEGENK